MLITLLCLQTGDRVNRHLFTGAQQGTSLQRTKHKSLSSNTDPCRTDPPLKTRLSSCSQHCPAYIQNHEWLSHFLWRSPCVYLRLSENSAQQPSSLQAHTVRKTECMCVCVPNGERGSVPGPENNSSFLLHGIILQVFGWDNRTRESKVECVFQCVFVCKGLRLQSQSRSRLNQERRK